MIKQTYCSKDLCLKLEKTGIEASHVMQFEKGGGWYKKYTLDVVCKWLREVYNLHIDIDPSEGDWNPCVLELENWSTVSGEDLHIQDTYDEAVVAAIEYCVDNLI